MGAETETSHHMNEFGCARGRQIQTQWVFMACNETDGALEWLGRSIRPPKSERRMQRRQGKARTTPVR